MSDRQVLRGLADGAVASTDSNEVTHIRRA